MKYEKPEFQIIELKKMDVITTSIPSKQAGTGFSENDF